MTLKELRSWLGKNKQFDDYIVVFHKSIMGQLDSYGIQDITINGKENTFTLNLVD